MFMVLVNYHALFELLEKLSLEAEPPFQLQTQACLCQVSYRALYLGMGCLPNSVMGDNSKAALE